MAASWLGNVCLAHSLFDGILQRLLVDVMPTFFAASWIT
jgi:hypothetical protein